MFEFVHSSIYTNVGLAIGLPLAGGMAAGVVTSQAVKGWYKTLNKPSWTPPDYAFGPIWTALYVSMGYASYLVSQKIGSADALDWVSYFVIIQINQYTAQLALNLAWTPLFFGAKQIGLAGLDIGALLGSVVITGLKFYDIDPLAGWLMLPYAAWVGVAASLNAYVWYYNSDSSEKSI